ncbi:hypothetical protein FOA52_014882 [Chlamydomonas sp. UWO 241]|nr:hypothetical protein FOA52_014882 [Chlamydomonas sp. UWO 241]
MYRDEVFLSRLLTLASRVYTTYVLPGCHPPLGLFGMRDPDYVAFLRHTNRLARGARLVAELPAVRLPRQGQDGPFV